ncbi:MAG: primosomal protein N', partial [Bacteroidales bacterium]|nr:primosomal protein N' [Bacteroidales bacterium]
MDRKTLFADVILPLPVPGVFTYRVPFDLNDEISLWKRVVVQFGKKKIYTAIVVNIHEIPPKNYSVKYLLSILDESPVMTPVQYNFWKWMADYYMCEPGEVMNVAIPSALKLASESRIVLNPEFKVDMNLLSEKEYLIAEALDIQKKLTLSEIEKIVGQKKVIPLIKTMMENGMVLMEEELKEKFKPKLENFIKLTDEYRSDDKLQELFNELEKRAFRQLEVLMTWVSLSGFGSEKIREVKQSELESRVKGAASAIKSLADKGVFSIEKRISSRLESFNSTEQPENIELNDEQTN